MIPVVHGDVAGRRRNASGIKTSRVMSLAVSAGTLSRIVKDDDRDFRNLFYGIPTARVPDVVGL